jgi:hypothetical protein
MLAGGEVIRQEFLLWKKVPGIFRELFLCSCQRGSRAMAFLWFFIFPETASRYSMMLGGFGREHVSPADVFLLQSSLSPIGRHKKS